MREVSPGGACEVVQLANGARAILDHGVGEVMHPGDGPLVESRDIYVGPSRLAARLAEPGPPLVVFDVGLGAASNAIAAWQVSAALPAAARRLELVSFEHDLGALRLALEPAHAAAFGLERPDCHAAARALVDAGVHEDARTTWRLVHGDFVEAVRRQPSASADIVFWDMYSARTGPALWSVATFTELRRTCRPGATLHTYSAATKTRTTLLLAGFAVGVGAPTGSRAESTIAATELAALAQPLGAAWLGRLERSQAPFGADLPPSAHAAARQHIQALPQFAAGELRYTAER